MADAAKSKFTFVLYAPDYTDPDAYNRRMAVRQSHLDNAKSLKEQGVMSGYLDPSGLFLSNLPLP